MDQVVQDVLDALERRDWAALRPLLHPYLHWSDADIRLRGRTNVLSHLADRPSAERPPGPPDAYELRDGQVYRWTG